MNTLPTSIYRRKWKATLVIETCPSLQYTFAMSVTLEYSDNVSRNTCAEQHDVKLQSDNSDFIILWRQKEQYWRYWSYKRKTHDSEGDSDNAVVQICQVCSRRGYRLVYDT